MISITSNVSANVCVNSGASFNHEDKGGFLRFLSNRTHQCKGVSQKRLSEVQSFLPSGFMQINQRESNLALHHFASLPNPHIETMIALFTNGTFKYINTANLGGGGVRGLTRLSAGYPEYILLPSSITIAPGGVAPAFIHEIGHALEGLLGKEAQKHGINFDSLKAQMFNEVRSSPIARSYAKSAPQEAFAEIYANYYCSEASRAELSNILSSDSVQKLSKVLKEPYWLTEAKAPADNSPQPTGALDSNSTASLDASTHKPEIIPEVQNPIKVALFDAPDGRLLMYLAYHGTAESGQVCSAQGCANISPKVNTYGKTFFTEVDASQIIGAPLTLKVFDPSRGEVVRNIKVQRR